jgi:predicted transcriptional regulator of viral defense system
MKIKFWQKVDERPLKIKVLDAMKSNGMTGITVAEVRNTIHSHHGYASATLSRLHEDGVVERLKATREGCKVYVLPEYVDGRDTELCAKDKKELICEEV